MEEENKNQEKSVYGARGRPCSLDTIHTTRIQP